MTPSEMPEDPTVDPDLAPPEPSENRRGVGELSDSEEPQAHEPEVTELSTQERNDFASLLTCGRRFKTISVMGHSVKIQTLKTGDAMRIGLFTKK